MIECTKCKVKQGTMALDGDVNKLCCPDCMRDWLYEMCCKKVSDINEHLPLLRALAADCHSVIEFGMRWARGSTVAFLAAQPETLISWDIDPACVLDQKVMDLHMLRGRTFFQPRVGDTLKIPPERCDLLFFDTLHTKDQLLAELVRHSDPGARPNDPTSRPVRKYLVFHDTSTFGRVGEDGKEPGIYAAIRHYQRNHAFPLWEVMPLAEVRGLTVDERQAIEPHCDKRRDGQPILNCSNNNGLIVLRYICAGGHGALTDKGQCTTCGEWTR